MNRLSILTRGRQPRARLASLLALVALAACAEDPAGNPFDPAAKTTVAGELRLVLYLPVGPGPGIPDTAGILNGLEVLGAPVDGGEPGLRCPESGEITSFCDVEPMRVERRTDGRLAYTGKFAAPAGSYDVSISHPDGLFIDQTRRVTFALAHRSADVEVQLVRDTLPIEAELVFEPGSPPSDAWVELRGLEDAEGSCLSGALLRHIPLGRAGSLSELADAPLPRPNLDYACILAGAQGYRTTVGTAPIGPLTGPPGTRVERLDFGPLIIRPAGIDVGVIGLPEARRIALGGPLARASRISSRLALLHLRTRDDLSFRPDAADDARIERLAVLDATQADAPGRGRYHPVDDLPQWRERLPYLGQNSPGACAQQDPGAEPILSLLVQATAPRMPGQEESPLLGRIRAAAPDERVLPICLSGSGVVQILAQTADGAVHRTGLVVNIDRTPIERLRLQVVESRDSAADQSLDRLDGRYAVRATSTARAVVTAAGEGPEAGTRRVLARVIEGEWCNRRWAFEDCPRFAAAVLRDEAEKPMENVVVEDFTGGQISIPLNLTAPPEVFGDDCQPPVEAPGEVGEEPGGVDPLRLWRNRVCLFVEDDVGNVRSTAFDVDVVAGRAIGELKPANDRDEWQASECEWGGPENIQLEDACFSGGPAVIAVNDRVGFEARIRPSSVHETVRARDAEGSQRFGLREVRIEIDALDGGPPITRVIDVFTQGMAIAHRFDGQGSFDLGVVGADLLGDEVPFEYAGAPRVSFRYDVEPPDPESVDFLTCEGCAAGRCDVAGEDEVRDPCERCISASFVTGGDGPGLPTLLAPAGATVPVSVSLGRQERGEQLCAVTRRFGGGAVQYVDTGRLCGSAVEIDGLQPDGALPAEGRTVSFFHDVIDRACNQVVAPDRLSVRFDGSDPTLAAAGDGAPAEGLGAEIVCRILEEGACDGAGETCWTTSEPDRGSCDRRGGLRILESVQFTVLDAASDLLPGPAIRYQFVLWPDGAPVLEDEALDVLPSDELPCSEPAWLSGDAPQPRQAGCVGDEATTRGCGCAAHREQISLFAGGQVIPTSVYRPGAEPGESRFLRVTPRLYDDFGALPEPDEADPDPDQDFGPALRVLRGMKLYVYLEDAVGNRAIRQLIDRGCEPDQGEVDCAGRTYTVAIEPPIVADAGIGADTVPWSQTRSCVDADGDGIYEPSGNPTTPEDPQDALCNAD